MTALIAVELPPGSRIEPRGNAVRLILVGIVALLTGCAVVENMTEAGPNRYQAQVRFGNGVSAEDDAKDAATKKCASLGKTLAELSIGMGHDEPAGHATVTFECR
jgi:hypothetical protein